MRPQEIKRIGNQLQQIKTNQMITRSFPRQRLGESVWVPNPFQGMAFFGFLKLFACWGSKQNKLPTKIQWINMWQDSILEDIQSISNQVAWTENQSLQSLQSFSHKPPNQTPLPNQQLNPTTNISRFQSRLPFPCYKKKRRFRESSRHLVDTRLHSKYFQSLLTSFDQVLCSIHHFV